MSDLAKDLALLQEASEHLGAARERAIIMKMIEDTEFNVAAIEVFDMTEDPEIRARNLAAVRGGTAMCRSLLAGLAARAAEDEKTRQAFNAKLEAEEKAWAERPWWKKLVG